MSPDWPGPPLMPRVAGAIGSSDDRLVAQLYERLPPDALPIVANPRAKMRTTLPVLRSGTDRFAWNPLAAGSTPTTWRTASQDRLAAGLALTPEGALIHSCAWGLQEIYFREIDGAIYFCDRIDPLVGLGAELLHTDWDAWASILTFGGPQGGATPFREIRRVRAASAIEVGSDGISEQVYEPTWLSVEPREGAVPPERVVDLLTSQMPTARLWDPPIDITLSGGWDSRLLAATASEVRGAGRIHAWTTSTDDGIDEDLEFAAPVARALRMKHHVLVPGPHSWTESRAELNDRVQYQTWMHTWLMPLAGKMRRRLGPLLDGLAGDTLFKDSFVDRDVLEAVDRRTALDRLAENLTSSRGTRPNIFAPATNAWLTETSRRDFHAMIERHAGHPQEYMLAKLGARTTRTIAASPLLVFGPERDVRLPFFAPEIIAAAFAIPRESKANGAYYRRLLAASASTAITGLPSTNDGRQKPRPGFRRQGTAAAVSDLAVRVLADEEIASVLAPSVLRQLADAEQHEEFGRWGGQLSAVQSLAMLADWRNRYSVRISSDGGPF